MRPLHLTFLLLTVYRDRVEDDPLFTWRVPFTRHTVMYWPRWWSRPKMNPGTYGPVYHAGPLSLYVDRRPILNR